MVNPDFCKLADAYGIPNRCVTQRDEIEDAVRFAQSIDGPTLIEFVVEKEEMVYPMVPAGADLHDMKRRPKPRRSVMAEIQIDSKVTVVALVENEPGVLNRIASLFRRRAFNIDSLTVGRTHKAHISRMTIRVDAGPEYARKIATNLQKLVNVIDVRIIDNEPHVERDLALIKVRNDDADSRNTITEICDPLPGAHRRCRVPKVAIIEMVGRRRHHRRIH